MTIEIDLTPKLSPRFAIYLRDYLLDRKLDADRMFAECGFEHVVESESALPISVTTVLTLFDRSAELSGDHLLGFNLARQYHYESSALIILAMLAAPSVADSIETLCFFDKYVDSAIKASYDFSGVESSFSVGVMGAEPAQACQLNEYLLTFVVATLNMATRKPMPLTAVYFQHERCENYQEIEAFYNAPVFWGYDSNRIHFDRGYLREHLYTSNSLLYDILQNALKTYFVADRRQSDFVNTICRELIRMKEVQTADLQTVADTLSLSTRTLRRRLKDEGLSFQQVKNLALESKAKYYLTNSHMSLSEVAFATGYTELSSFVRAFKNWTGITPNEYRASARKLISA